MADEIERMQDLLEDAEQEWPDEPVINNDAWRRLASLAAANGMPSAAAGCLAAAGEWPVHTGWLTVREDFDTRINAIGERHGFPWLSEHLDVCVFLHFLVRSMPPHVEASDGVISAEQGATSWRDLRRKMPGWMSRVSTSGPDLLYLLALELHSDDTSLAAASLAGVRRQLTALVMRLETLIALGPVLTSKRWSDAVKVLSDPGPIGLEGILSKIALPMWAPEDYKRLWSFIGCPHAVDYMLHAPALTAHQIAILHELPPILRHDAIARHLQRPLEARVLAHAFGDQKRAKMLLRAAKQSKNRKSLFGKASNILSKAWKFAAAPEVDHPNITPIRTDAELRRVALRFRNCLRDHADKASVGEVAFFVYDGDEPAVIMISPRVAGTYVIEQMLGPGNAFLSTTTQQVIHEALAGIGVVDRREAARRKAIDHCLSSLRLAQINAAEELDRYCRAFFNQMEIAELPDSEFWPFWL